jgi:hypothetical protein
MRVDTTIFGGEEEFNVPARGVVEHFCEGEDDFIGVGFGFFDCVVVAACFELPRQTFLFFLGGGDSDVEGDGEAWVGEEVWVVD